MSPSVASERPLLMLSLQLCIYIHISSHLWRMHAPAVVWCCDDHSLCLALCISNTNQSAPLCSLHHLPRLAALTSIHAWMRIFILRTEIIALARTSLLQLLIARGDCSPHVAIAGRDVLSLTQIRSWCAKIVKAHTKRRNIFKWWLKHRF